MSSRTIDAEAMGDFVRTLKVSRRWCISCGEELRYPAEHAPKSFVKHPECPLTEEWY